MCRSASVNSIFFFIKKINFSNERLTYVLVTFSFHKTSLNNSFNLFNSFDNFSYEYRLIAENKDNPDELNINCVDPLNRSALISAIENENIELIKILLAENIKVNDALLHAISEQYVEAVELLLQHEETNHIPGQPYVIINILFAYLKSFQSKSRQEIAYNGSLLFFVLSHGNRLIVQRRHLHRI